MYLCYQNNNLWSDCDSNECVNAADNLAEVTDCLSTVSAIIDQYGIESVYMLGDFIMLRRMDCFSMRWLAIVPSSIGYV